ncbi:hypothetical protein N8579_00035 [bacterium]|jgi:hypothetical protein|nr:hypothetical protein [bacterium]
MANAEETNKILKENNQLLNQFLKSQAQINSEAQEELRFTRDINNEIREGLKLVNKEVDLKNTVRKSLSAINKIAEQNFGIAKLEVSELQDQANLNKKLGQLAKDRNSLKIQGKDIEILINQKLAESEGLEGKKLELNQKQIQSLKKVQEGINDQVLSSDNYVKNLKNALTLSSKISKNQGVGKTFDGVGKVIDKIPGMSGLGDAFKAGAKDAKNIAARMTKTNALAESYGMPKKFSQSQIQLTALTKGFKALGGVITKVLLPLALLKNVLSVDKQTGQMAKDLNMSYEESLKLRSELTNIANQSGKTSVYSKGLAETFSHINKTLGTNVMLNKEDLVTFTKLHKSAGLTNEELMGTFKLTLGTNKSLKEATGEILAQAKTAALKNGVSLNEKETLKEINKVSAATTLSLGKNPAQIAEAVATAKSLGMELGKVDAIANSLLDFESSITSELEAELLLGKNINLEKARQFALDNNLAGVAKEISSQIGDSAEFTKLNRIQQDALAKSVGMNRDELAETLYIQDQLKGATGEQAKEQEALLQQRISEVGLAQAQKEMAKDGIKGLEAQKSVSEKLEAITSKISDLFATMAPAILNIANALTLVFEPLNLIFSVIGFIGDLFSGIGEKIGNLVGPLGVVGKILKGLASVAIVFAAYKAYASLASIPILGVPLGIAAAAAVTAAGFGLLNGIKTGDDVMSPGQNTSGYGNRTLMGPEGAIALNNKDTVIAGTNLFDKGDDVISKGAGEVKIPTQDNRVGEQTNRLLATLVGQNSKKPELSPVGLYEVQ